jgi:RHS repeat-associated protein
MQWGQAGKTRKYDFTYDNLSRLKAATYTGDGNFNTAYSYDKHGNMLTLQRYGMTAAATYGIIDNLTMTYTGNQMKAVSDAVDEIPLNTSMDFKDYTKGTGVEYTYNKNGAMTQDLNKGISQIQYNSLNLPQIVDIKNKTTEGRNEYTYSASGQKLKAVQKWNPNYSTTPVIGSTVNTATLTQSQTTDYVGNIIYENNALKRILVDGGYYESGNYYFYINDHLGNNRIVTDAAASVVQSTQYYPFGTSFADASGTSTQPYKYNGKELDARNGLNMYDYSARWKDDFRFTTVDPLAENDYNWSPYAYVTNNPLRFTDPTGMTPNDSIKDGGSLSPVTIEGTLTTANTVAYYALPMVSYANDADRVWTRGDYWSWAGNIVLGTADGLTTALSLGTFSIVKGGTNALAKGTVKATTRGLWTLSKKYAASIKSHPKWGKIYKSKSDGLWWAVDITKHGGSEFKVFKETPKGLEWIHDADKYGDFIQSKHKSTTGTSITWSELKTIY